MKAYAFFGTLAAAAALLTGIARAEGEAPSAEKQAQPKTEGTAAKPADPGPRLAEFQKALLEFGRKGDLEGALKLVNDTLAKGGLERLETQKLMITRALILSQQRKFDDALKAVDEAKAFAPDTEIGKRADQFRSHLEQARNKPLRELPVVVEEEEE